MVPFCKYPVATGQRAAGLVLVVLTIVGSSNAVNLTDGLDGLAIGCTMIVSFVFLIMTYVAGNVKAAAYLQIPHVPGAGELTVFCAALIGAGHGISLVQLPSGAGVHGRHGLAGAGRGAGDHRRADPSAAGAGDRGRGVCDGSRVGDFADGIFQIHAEAVRNRANGFF